MANRYSKPVLFTEADYKRFFKSYGTEWLNTFSCIIRRSAIIEEYVNDIFPYITTFINFTYKDATDDLWSQWEYESCMLAFIYVIKIESFKTWLWENSDVYETFRHGVQYMHVNERLLRSRIKYLANTLIYEVERQKVVSLLSDDISLLEKRVNDENDTDNMFFEYVINTHS